MKITVNLASKPYVDLHQVLRQLRILMGILLLVAIPLWLLWKSEKKTAAAATARVDAVENRVERLQQQQQSYQVLMRQPQNAAVLTQSDFLNSLFQRKAFSWTATMTDLETVLPAGVQVLSIEPEVAKDGQVTIRLRVSGARDKAVSLVRNLEKSRHFAAPRLAGEALAQANSGPNAAVEPISAALAVNFDILADYRPLSEVDESAAKTDAQPEKSGSKEKTSEAETPAKKNVNAPTQPAAAKKRGVK